MEGREFPYDIEDLSQEEMEHMKAQGVVRPAKAVRIRQTNTVLHEAYRRVASIYYNFSFGSNDVVVASYPKSGTMWLREVLWGLRNPDRLHIADEERLGTRTFFIDHDLIGIWNSQTREILRKQVREKTGEEVVDDQFLVTRLASAHLGLPRVIASHLHFGLLNPDLINTCKVVYIARNPKDVCLSYYKFLHAIGSFNGDLNTFVEMFMKGETVYGLYWEHLKQAWKLKDHPNLHFIFFEDMKSNPMKEVSQLSHFLGLDLSEDQLKRVVENTSYERMKAREKTLPLVSLVHKGKDSFFQGGRVGGWEDHALKELTEKMDAWIAENSKDTDISFRYS